MYQSYFILPYTLSQVKLKSDEIAKLNKDAKNTASKMAECDREVKHREELIDRLTHEITTLQEELTKSHEKLSDYETNVQKLRNKLEQRAIEVRFLTLVTFHNKHKHI